MGWWAVALNRVGLGKVWYGGLRCLSFLFLVFFSFDWFSMCNMCSLGEYLARGIGNFDRLLAYHCSGFGKEFLLFNS